MAGPELFNNGWITVPWAEFVGRHGDQGASFTSGWNDDSQAVFNILVDWENGQQAEEDILGIAFFDGIKLRRTPPVQHPIKFNMRAEKILAAHPVAWNGKEFVDLPYAPGAGGNNGALSSYIFWMISIGFSVPKYAIVTDSDLDADYGGLEFYRWCEPIEDDHMESMTRENGSFVWKSTSSPNGPVVNSVFPAPLPQYFKSSTIKLLWRRVPRRGLIEEGGEGSLMNHNIRDTVGSVHNGATPIFSIGDGPPYNNANSNGSALRLLSAKQRPISSPLSPTFQGLSWSAPNTYHDVEFTFHYWNPESGDGVNFGHNLAPAPAMDGKWYLVKTNNAAAATIYPVTDLTIIFQLSIF